MKTYSKILFSLVILLSLSTWSCKDYLEKTQKADISEPDVFTTFTNFQGYVETMYDDIVDPVHSYYLVWNNGDDMIAQQNQEWMNGNYFALLTSNRTKYYNTAAKRERPTTQVDNFAIWQNSWFGIRAANISLAHLKDLVEATDEQKQLIEGQAYFYRAYFHWELMQAWGKIPYIDTVFTALSDLRVPQKGLYETAELILSDFQKAADLLPEDWDLTATGKEKTLGKNFLRPSKGMALANMAECLLFCGSPLFNGVETGNYVYNTEYCKRAANAAWKVIQIANTGRYALEPWATYNKLFYKKDNTLPLTKEHIFSDPDRGNDRYNTNGYNWANNPESPTQNYAELFEMANGLPISDPASNFKPMDPWSNRDPRFKYNFMLDGDRIITSQSTPAAFAQFYIGGAQRATTGSISGYMWKKWWDATMNMYDNGWSQLRLSVPKIRLAEIYLFYAEAANEAYNGPTGKDPEANLTAVDAVNLVRARPGLGMPGVNAKFLVSKEAFRDRIWNERAVELAYEDKRWNDLRRWHVHHLTQYKELYELQFDKNHTYFNRVLSRTIQFTEHNYWLPFPTNQITLYPEWKQNPGW